MGYLAKNNAVSVLAAPITDIATNLSVQTGHGDRFPVIAGADYTFVTLEDTSGNIEIVKVTERTAAADTMTIVRAQESTTAKNFASGSIVSLRLTAGVFNEHFSDAADAHAASAITNTPSGNLSSTNVQAALNELQADIDTVATTSTVGRVEFATNAETEAGTDSVRAVVPSGLFAALRKFGIGTTDMLDYSGDCNNLTTSGTYFVSSAVSNIPTPGSTWYFLVFANANNDVTQYAIHIAGTNGVYIRRGFSPFAPANWGAWEMIGALKATQAQVNAGTSDSTFVTPLTLQNKTATAASAISVTPTGNLSSTNVQNAINELQSDIDAFSINPSFSSITSSGLITANGNIKFPTTQVPSEDANTLDDYKEGTWAPIALNGGNAISHSDSKYVKIGKQVTVRTNISLNTQSSANVCVMGGLPFPAESVTSWSPTAFSCTDAGTTDVSISNTGFSPFSGGTTTYRTWAQMSGDTLTFVGTYFTAT